jgi:hypothetical protein
MSSSTSASSSLGNCSRGGSGPSALTGSSSAHRQAGSLQPGGSAGGGQAGGRLQSAQRGPQGQLLAPPPSAHLAQDVLVEGVALADGRVQRDDHQRLRHVGLGQQEDAHDGVVADAEVLGLCGEAQRAQRSSARLG